MSTEQIVKCPNCGDLINPLARNFHVKLELLSIKMIDSVFCNEYCAIEWCDAEAKKTKPNLPVDYCD